MSNSFPNQFNLQQGLPKPKPKVVTSNLSNLISVSVQKPQIQHPNPLDRKAGPSFQCHPVKKQTANSQPNQVLGVLGKKKKKKSKGKKGNQQQRQQQLVFQNQQRILNASQQISQNSFVNQAQDQGPYNDLQSQGQYNLPQSQGKLNNLQNLGAFNNDFSGQTHFGNPQQQTQSSKTKGRAQFKSAQPKSQSQKNIQKKSSLKQFSNRVPSKSVMMDIVEPIMIPDFNFNDLPRYIHMDTGDTIYLDTFSKLIYQPNHTNFVEQVLARPDMWHQFVVHHNGEFSKDDILMALFRAIRTHEIFPIGYRCFAKFDSFLLTASDRNAIEILFNRNLKIKLRDRELCMSVRLGSGQIVMGQVHPKTQIILVCRELLEKAFLHGGNQIVDFEGFERHKALAEVAVSMANNYHLTTIIKALQENEAAVKMVKGIKMTNCNLERLEPLRYLVHFDSLVHLNLRNNNINSVLEMKHLEKLNLIQLDIAGNPFSEDEEQTYIQERIKKMLPTLKYIDGNEVQMIKIKIEPNTASSGQDLYFDIMFDGDCIKAQDDINPDIFKQKYKGSNYWHKVIVYHEGKFNRRQIISKLFNMVENNDLWPCYYQSFEKYDEFFVHNNFEALEILLRNRLIIRIVGSDDIIALKLHMNVAPFKVGQVNVVEKIQKTCMDQFVNKTLYLNGLAEREIFANVIIDMSSPRVVSQILLWASRKCGSTCVSLHLNNNGMVACAGMYPLVWFTQLKELNLRNNRIETFERVSGIPQANNIVSLILEGNPLCNVSPQQYIKNSRHYFPELQTLDGITFGDDISTIARQNYLCRPEAYSLVEAFVKHYFTIYDSNQRQLLKELYTDNALFSLNCNFDVHKPKEVLRMAKYSSKSRNLVRLTNLDQASRNMIVGADEIMKTLIEMHSTEHDFLSFEIDVPIYTQHTALIIVHGIFKDKPSQFLDEEFLLYFTRTFFIRATGTGMGVSGLSFQYKIQNDLLTIKNITLQQKSIAFQTPNIEQVNDELSEPEKDNLVVVFQEITKMNRRWCFKFLDEAKWNFKIALNICVKLLEDDKVPNDAFDIRSGY